MPGRSPDLTQRSPTDIEGAAWQLPALADHLALGQLGPRDLRVPAGHQATDAPRHGPQWRPHLAQRGGDGDWSDRSNGLLQRDAASSQGVGEPIRPARSPRPPARREHLPAMDIQPSVEGHAHANARRPEPKKQLLDRARHGLNP